MKRNGTAQSGCKAQWPLAVCGLWLVVGFIGASTLAAGLRQWFDGELAWQAALAWVLFGATLATAGWRRSRSVLEQAKRARAVDVRRRRAARALQAYRSRGASEVASYPNTTEPEAQ